MNCKPGDLAIVLFVAGDPPFQANIGRIVQVLHRADSKEYKGYGVLQRWWIRSEGSPMISGEGPKHEGIMPDIALRPIRPLDEPDHVEREEKLLEPA